jgi:DNA-binding NtrC family response regulator
MIENGLPGKPEGRKETDMKRTILCLSFDEIVSASRRSALEEAGYAVIATTQAADALELLSSVAFDLMIVGHRFSAADKHKLAAEARDKGIPVLLICGASADVDVPADARVYALEGIAGMVATVAKLLSRTFAVSTARAA